MAGNGESDSSWSPSPVTKKKKNTGRRTTLESSNADMSSPIGASASTGGHGGAAQGPATAGYTQAESEHIAGLNFGGPGPSFDHLADSITVASPTASAYTAGTHAAHLDSPGSQVTQKTAQLSLESSDTTSTRRSPRSNLPDVTNQSDNKKPASSKAARTFRSCKECRRRKIKCVSIEGQEKCQNCNKTNTACFRLPIMNPTGKKQQQEKQGEDKPAVAKKKVQFAGEKVPHWKAKGKVKAQAKSKAVAKARQAQAAGENNKDDNEQGGASSTSASGVAMAGESPAAAAAASPFSSDVAAASAQLAAAAGIEGPDQDPADGEAMQELLRRDAATLFGPTHFPQDPEEFEFDIGYGAPYNTAGELLDQILEDRGLTGAGADTAFAHGTGPGVGGSWSFEDDDNPDFSFFDEPLPPREDAKKKDDDKAQQQQQQQQQAQQAQQTGGVHFAFGQQQSTATPAPAFAPGVFGPSRPGQSSMGQSSGGLFTMGQSSAGQSSTGQSSTGQPTATTTAINDSNHPLAGQALEPNTPAWRYSAAKLLFICNRTRLEQLQRMDSDQAREQAAEMVGPVEDYRQRAVELWESLNEGQEVPYDKIGYDFLKAHAPQ